MIRHIVLWNLKNEADGLGKVANAQILKQRLEALPGLIPEIQSLEVGLNFNHSEAACEVALLTSFHHVADLQVYQQHPAHQDVVAFVRRIVTDRHVVDYETP